MKQYTRSVVAVLMLFTLSAPAAHAVELLGLLSYNLSQVPTPPTNYLEKGNSIGYGFLGRLDLGPGKIETGFLYTTASITTRESFGDLVVTGTYWMLPVLYRYTFLEPFFSIAAGFDYAAVGTRSAMANGAQFSGVTSGFRGHWGLQFSLEGAQDLGENLSAVLDLRYRRGLADAISFGSEGSRYDFWTIALGLQKRFDP